MRKLIYYVATTADGFIADEAGGFDAFPMEGEHFPDLIADYPETFPGAARDVLGIKGPNREFDTVLMGRATYDVGAKVGQTSPYPHLAQYVFSRTLERSPDPAVELVTADAPAFVRALKMRPGRNIWLCGGSKLAANLFREIDELILKVNPVLLGAGIPLFARAVPATRLRPLARKVYGNGFVRLHFAVR